MDEFLAYTLRIDVPANYRNLGLPGGTIIGRPQADSVTNTVKAEAGDREKNLSRGTLGAVVAVAAAAGLGMHFATDTEIGLSLFVGGGIAGGLTFYARRWFMTHVRNWRQDLALDADIYNADLQQLTEADKRAALAHHGRRFRRRGWVDRRIP